MGGEKEGLHLADLQERGGEGGKEKEESLPLREEEQERNLILREEEKSSLLFTNKSGGEREGGKTLSLP